MTEIKKVIERNLPKDWSWLRLGDICKVLTGTTPPKSDLSNYGNDIPFFKPPHLWDGIISETEEMLSLTGAERARVVPPNSVLVTCIGNLGRTGYVKKTAAFNQQLNAILENENLIGKFIFYQAQSPLFKGQLEKLATGTTVSIVNKSNFETIGIVVPPISFQLAIVSKIEELFSELDKGIENLRIAQLQLKTYRQAVLKWAFEGKLTEQWRKENSFSNGKDILLRIENKRTGKLKELISNGNKESNRILSKIRKHKFKNPEGIEIPKQWVWASFLNACYLVVDCHNKTAPYQDNGIYLIRTSNIKNGKLLLEEKMKYVSVKTYDYWSRRCPPQSDDILFTREAPMGESAIIPKGIKVCMGQRIMLLRTFPELLSTKYLHYAMMDSTFQQRMNNNAIGTGVKHLRVGDVEELVFPICSTEEQNKIVEEIESRLSVADKMEESIKQSLQQAEGLRQSILKKAFEGKLV